jgi:hypothetical protein
VGRDGLGCSAQDHRCHGPWPNRDKDRNRLPNDYARAEPERRFLLARLSDYNLTPG